jgi:hypothetical protein
MPLDLHDPHVALGIAHAQRDLPRYAWQDREHQRRYDLGYLTGRGERPASTLTFTELETLMEQLGYVRDR